MNKRKLFAGTVSNNNKLAGTSAYSAGGRLQRTYMPKANSAFANIATGAMITYDAYQSLPPSVKNQFVNFGNAVKSGIIKNNNNKNNNNRGNRMNGRNNNRKGNPLKNAAGRDGADAGTFYLSSAVKPTEISLKSGIYPNTYSSDYMDAIENNCSPLHLSSSILKIPSTDSFDLCTYFKQITAFDIQSKAQANVGFSLDITNSFSSDQLLTAFNALINALQCYFYYASIITYHDNPKNKNMGMISMRTAMTTDDFNDLARLGRLLSDIPIPPNLLSLTKYLSGNFLSGTNPGSPMIKLVPGEITSTGLLGTDSGLATALSNLTSDDNINVFTLLRRSVPQWIPGSLSDVPSEPIFDENFKTIFANLPFRLANSDMGTSEGFPRITLSGAYLQYNSFSNNLDGVAYALTGYYDSSDVCYPGLTTPYTNGKDIGTRKSYYEVSGVKEFYDTGDYEYISRCRPETYSAAGLSTVEILDPIHLPGSNKCLGVNTESIRETAYKTIDWMMSLNTIRKGLINKQIL